MLTISPSINPDIYLVAPGFRALSIYVTGMSIQNPTVGKAALNEACKAVLAGNPEWAEAHLSAWSDVFWEFGAKPKRTPCSAEALHKRVLRDRTIASLSPVVDLYNAVSLRYAIPVGGENIDGYKGIPRLTFALGTEIFDTIKDGKSFTEYPVKGEIIWCDDIGVTRRCWNWKQSIRTRLNVEVRNMWFILESLPQMPIEQLHEAGRMLTDGLERMMPGLWFEVEFIQN
ncbi:B3/4 domain-containing protein [Morganella sp. Je.2.23]|uniref:B3/B4 domain-containing protein n=1 Tax=Morganella sp. Je.2.23 TaxID=3142840 RepID=UPI003DA9D8D5